MEVGDLCTRNMVTIGAHASVVDAAQIMRKDHVGLLVVTEPAADGHDSKVNELGDVSQAIRSGQRLERRARP